MVLSAGTRLQTCLHCMNPSADVPAGTCLQGGVCGNPGSCRHLCRRVCRGVCRNMDTQEMQFPVTEQQRQISSQDLMLPLTALPAGKAALSSAEHLEGFVSVSEEHRHTASQEQGGGSAFGSHFPPDSWFTPVPFCDGEPWNRRGSSAFEGGPTASAHRPGSGPRWTRGPRFVGPPCTQTGSGRVRGG